MRLEYRNSLDTSNITAAMTVPMLLHPPSKSQNIDPSMPDSEPAVIRISSSIPNRVKFTYLHNYCGPQKRDGLDTSNISAAMTIPFLLHTPSKPHNLDPSIYTHTLILIPSHPRTLTTILLPPCSYYHTQTAILIPPYHHTLISSYPHTLLFSCS